MKRRKAILAAVLVMVMGITFTACGNASGSDPDHNDGIEYSYSDTEEYPVTAAVDTQTASEAFGEGGIWYYVSSDASQTGRNTVVNEVLVFDGKGNVTSYYTGSGEALTLGDLRGKTDEEIIQIATAKDEEANVSLIEKGGGSRAEYEKPEPQPYTLHIYTDSTGNTAEYEQLTYPSNYRTNHATWGAYELGYNPYIEIGEHTDTVVYDMRFVGYKSYVTKIDSASQNVSYGLDQPGTAGVEVD